MSVVSLVLHRVPLQQLCNKLSWAEKFEQTPKGEFIKTHKIGDYSLVESWDKQRMVVNQTIEVFIEEKDMVLYKLKF